MGIDIKSVGLVLVTRLTIRGSGLPIGVKRATQKPHAEYVKMHRLARVPTHDYIHTQRHLLLLHP